MLAKGSFKASHLLVAAVVLGVLAIVPQARAAGAAQDTPPAKDTFNMTCALCHGEDGAGTPTGQALKAPDLRSDDVQKQTNETLEGVVSAGKNNMPPFKDTLSKAQITGLVAYVRTL